MPVARTFDGVPIWYEIEGAGPSVVLLPGRGDCSDLYPRSFTDAVVAAGFSVLRMDPRDTGLSGAGGDTYTMSTLADDAARVMDDATIERSRMIGFSMGGLVLTDFASRNPQRVLSCSFISAMSPDPDAGIGPMPSSRAEYITGMGHLPTRAEWALITQLIASHLRTVPT